MVSIVYHTTEWVLNLLSGISGKELVCTMCVPAIVLLVCLVSIFSCLYLFIHSIEEDFMVWREEFLERVRDDFAVTAEQMGQ